VIEANTEFYGALWAWPHILLKRLGLIYVMTLHDPVRGLWFGPKWFSRLSLWAAYRLLSGGLVHGDPPPTAYLPKWMKVASVPHGLFDHMAMAAAPFDLRERLGIPESAYVLLSFGHIADRKNQHLLVEAVARQPRTQLIIAGPQMSRRNRPPQYYRDLAAGLNCAHRVHVVDRFIDDAEVPGFFAAADAVALTYDGGFVSQSGVLQIAGQWDKPVLASGGAGALKETIEKFDLGLFVKPDDGEAVATGLAALMSEQRDRRPNFVAFRESASWAANVDGLLALLRDIRVQRRR
jgi:glycosyltransferase involved in cell wall biosynthesis